MSDFKTKEFMAHIKIGSICCHVDLSAELSDKVQQVTADYKKESKTDGCPRHIFYIGKISVRLVQYALAKSLFIQCPVSPGRSRFERVSLPGVTKAGQVYVALWWFTYYYLH